VYVVTRSDRISLPMTAYLLSVVSETGRYSVAYLDTCGQRELEKLDQQLRIRVELFGVTTGNV